MRIRWYEIQSRRLLLFISVCCCGFLCWWCDDRCVRTDMFTRPTIPYYVGFFLFDLLLRRLLLLFFTSLDFFERNNLTSGQQQQHPIIKLNERRRNVQTHTGDIVQWTGLFLSVYFTSFFFHSTSNFEYSKFQTLIWLEKSFKIFIFLNSTRNFQYFKF